MSDVYYGMAGVEDILYEILEYGVDVKNDRTGELTRAIFDGKIVLENGFEFTTNVLASPRLAFEEFMFFLRGQTDTSILEEKGVNFWVGNTSREFLNARGLTHLPEKSIGSAYSKQWRDSGGIDQLEKLIHGLKNDRYGRRHLIDLWNPSEEHEMPLTPCHYASQYVILPCPRGGKDTLNVKLVNRSLDTAFGARFAIMQYTIFQMMLAKMLGCSVGSFSLDLTHIHVYTNQIEYIRELLGREYVDCSPDGVSNSLKFTKDIDSLGDLLSVEWCDFEMTYEWNKTPFKTKRPDMVA